MSTAVQSALIGGVLALAGSFVTLWWSNRAERQRAKLQFNAGIKAKLMDYEREDRLALARPIRDYLHDIGKAFGSASQEEDWSGDGQASAQAWYQTIVAQLVEGTTLRYSINDDTLCRDLDELVIVAYEYARVLRDTFFVPPGLEMEDTAKG